jgi:hypothetical protein
LKNNYTYKNVKNICELLNYKFTYDAITTKALKLGICTRSLWSGEEDNIMKNYYPFKSPKEMLELLPKRNVNSIIKRAVTLGIQNIVTKKLWFSEEDIDFIKNNWKVMSDEEIGKYLNRNKHAICDKRCQLGLLRIHDESSYENLSEFVRRNNLEWKKQSMLNCNYKCIVTGERFDDIHHLYGLNLILNEVLLYLNIDVKERMDDYSEEELSSILYTFRIFQNKYPLGVCLKKEIHTEFHSIYGFGNNTLEQWDNFLLYLKNNNSKSINYKCDGDESRKN